MREENMRFGTFIRQKRINDSRGLTLKDVAAELNLSLSYLSDIEQNRRSPLDSKQIDKLCDFLNLTEEDKHTMLDLAAKETSRIPSDIEDVMMYTEEGSNARRALRMTNAGYATNEDWKEFIQKLEARRREQEGPGN